MINFASGLVGSWDLAKGAMSRMGGNVFLRHVPLVLPIHLTIRIIMFSCTSGVSDPACIRVSLRILILQLTSTIPFVYRRESTAVQSNSRRVAHNLPDFDG